MRLTLKWFTSLVSGVILASAGGALATSDMASAATPPSLRVSGNQLVDGSGAAVRLLGVNRSGTEFMCVQNRGLFDGPSDDASVTAIANWHVNAVRIPLNEDCWLNINGVNSAYAGANYQTAVRNYVNLLHNHGIVAILDLHWTDGVYSNNCSSYGAQCQKPMPDSDHAPAFWQSVANAYKGDLGTVFDIFNEPFPDRVDAGSAWNCWRDGGSACVNMPFAAAGMQSLVNSVRGTGAQNVILLGGLSYSNDETQWLSHKPTDSTGNLAASWHSYNFNACIDTNCWNSQIAPVAAQVPLVTGEIGENDCAHGYIDSLMNWLDSKGLSYLGWTWNTWDCSSGPALITDYSGTPTNFGVGLKNHLASLPSGGGGGSTGGDTTAPSVPAGLQVTGTTAASVSLAWTASKDNVGVTGYDVYRGATKVSTAVGTTYTDTGLAASTAYAYTVRARDAAGNVSAASNPVTGRTLAGGGDTTAPSVPGSVHVTGTTASSVSLTWTASTDNVGVTGYDVYRGTTKVVTVSSTSYTDTGLAASTAYSYSVVARDAAGNSSAASAAAAATTSAGTGGAGCTATFHNDNDWGSGFTGTVTVTAGSAAITGWTVTVTFAGDQTVTNIWNANGSASAHTETATNLSYNGSLGAGANTAFSFQASYSGANATPALGCTKH
jgi:chitodextrinase